MPRLVASATPLLGVLRTHYLSAATPFDIQQLALRSLVLLGANASATADREVLDGCAEMLPRIVALLESAHNKPDSFQVFNNMCECAVSQRRAQSTKA